MGRESCPNSCSWFKSCRSTDSCIESFKSREKLFKDEHSFLKTFIDTDVTEEKTTTLSREDIAKKQSRTIKMETNYASIRQHMSDILREKKEIIRKRKIMISTYFIFY